ncbi:DUF1493 family protein [Pantoea sp. A4]|uniref:DUF1493 family protein n=1 Tax=Pantoea sp. A4 TaxID=1225184 RepID=UPI000377A2E2|nr:DUF1493 family protein [Pantoea sp. A4]
MTTAEEVKAFLKQELPLITTLLFKKCESGDSDALQELHEAEDIYDMFEAYWVKFNVDPAQFSLGNYYPWRSQPLFSRKPVNLDKKRLTINMLINSAKAGRWLYG